jgi:catechol 2,3-dioxygenase-like lactoylglutathione lyase family enzyme
MSRREGPTHTSAPPKLPARLRLGAVHLSVSDLESSVEFYEDAIGLGLHHREDSVAAMGVGEEDLLDDPEEVEAVRERVRARPASRPRSAKVEALSCATPGGSRCSFPRPEPRGMKTASNARKRSLGDWVF